MVFFSGLWNHVFLFSNLSLFVFLPFAYLFTESEGFSWSKKGLWARVQETFVVLCLVALLVLGMVYVISAVFGDAASRQVDSKFFCFSESELLTRMFQLITDRLIVLINQRNDR